VPSSRRIVGWLHGAARPAGASPTGARARLYKGCIAGRSSVARVPGRRVVGQHGAARPASAGLTVARARLYKWCAAGRSCVARVSGRRVVGWLHVRQSSSWPRV